MIKYIQLRGRKDLGDHSSTWPIITRLGLYLGYINLPAGQGVRYGFLPAKSSKPTTK